MTLPHNRFDALVIGAGGAGLKAASDLSRKGYRVAVVSKVFPTRSHTVAAQGGVNASLANVTPDHWHWHMFDTVKGSDYLGDQDAIEYMCRQAPQTVYELEHDGVPFSRLDNGRIYQRPFGGQSQNFGGDQAARTCAAADRTGHAILHTLFQQNLRANTLFLNEVFAIDLIKNTDGAFAGALVIDIASGEVSMIEAKAVLLATGGCGQLFRTNTNAHINTGDGMAMALRAGLPLQDMEFFQFHPTGIAGKGLLITEGARGEGGILINGEGERFMERYAPNAKELASRDVVSRAISTEVREGRGCGPNKDHVWLRLEHLGDDVLSQRLPGIRETVKTFLNVDPVDHPIPVYPTAHYAMGGIPTDIDGRVLSLADGVSQPTTGLYAAGECACVSIHGANRLGGNSLLDILVFGRSAGFSMAEFLDQAVSAPLDPQSLSKAQQRLERWSNTDNGETVSSFRNDLQTVMEKHCGVFRNEEVMREGIGELIKLRDRLPNVRLRDQSQVYNTARIEALELENLMDIAMATMMSAEARQESRGAHSRTDYPKRDDTNWLVHSLYQLDGDKLEHKPVQTKPLTVDSFPPKERVY